MSDAMEPVVTLQFDSHHAWALALFVKRVGWGDIVSNASDTNEAYDMRDALVALQNSLIVAGYSPR